MRVAGATLLRPKLKLLGFSPLAIFSPPSTSLPSAVFPVIRMSSIDCPRSFAYTVCPPITFPLPGMMFAVVTPPAVAMRMPASCGLMASSARTPGCTGPLDSPPSDAPG